MSVSVDKGRGVITENIEVIKKIYEVAPMSVALSIFKDSKLDELVNVYSKAPAEERTKVSKLLEPIYPTDHEKIEQIRKGAETR